MTSTTGTSSAATALRDKLLAAGLDELRENGVAAVSIRAVARRAGVSHAAPGYQFGDRAGLLTAIAAAGFALFADALRRSTADLADTTPPRERILRVGHAYLDFARREPALYSLMFDSGELRRQGDEFIEKSHDAFGVISASIPGDDPLDPLLAWTVVHGLAGITRGGALNTQAPTEEAERALVDALLQRVATDLSESPA